MRFRTRIMAEVRRTLKKVSPLLLIMVIFVAPLFATGCKAEMSKREQPSETLSKEIEHPEEQPKEQPSETLPRRDGASPARGPASAPSEAPVPMAEKSVEAKAVMAKAKIVYNIIADSKKSKNPLIFFPDQKTTLTFSIGPPLDETLSDIAPSDKMEDLAKGKQLDLNVTLDCLLCAKEKKHQRRVTYYAEKRKSSLARFEIDPAKEAVAKSKGLGKLIFTVDAEGIIIDRIQIQAFVGDPSHEALSEYSQPTKLSFIAPPVKNANSPDVIIQVGAGGGDKLPVWIRPVLQDLRDKFEESFPHGSGKDSNRSWEFTSGLTQNDLEDLVRDIYLSFRTIVNQNEHSLQKIYQHVGVNVTILSGAISHLKFEDKEHENILNKLKEDGANLYWRLFEKGATADLSTAMRIIEEFKPKDGRKLRVDIWATNVYVPWQILYSSNDGKTNPYKFWGFRYELGVVQQENGTPGRQINTIRPPKAEEVLFAAWRGTDNKDLVAERAKVLGETFREHFGKDVRQAFEREEFIKKLKEGANNVKLVFAYGHGSSGTVLSEAPSATLIPTIETEAMGVRFLFSNENWLIPRNLDDLVRRNNVRLKLQPIVILNACETGTLGNRPMNNNGFVGALTRLGAGAVFVTEGPVWANFAFHFGKHLTDELIHGHEMRQAMLNVRLKHLEEWNNPLGLIYTLYGNPALHFEQ